MAAPIEDASSPLARCRIDHLYAPYCPGHGLVRLLREVYQLEVHPYNIIDLEDQDPASLPSHIRAMYQEIRSGVRQVRGGLFFLEGVFVGTAFDNTLREALEARGLRPSGKGLPPLPLARLVGQAHRRGTLLIKSVTQDDIGGQGLASPAHCPELQFGACGCAEVASLLAGWTGRLGACMLGAWQDGFAAGFVTFAPLDAALRIGWLAKSGLREEELARPSSTLLVLCLFVYPHVRRQGVATALVGEVLELGRDTGMERVVAFVSPGLEASCQYPAGIAHPYWKNGFTQSLLAPSFAASRLPPSSRERPALYRMTYLLSSQ